MMLCGTTAPANIFNILHGANTELKPLPVFYLLVGNNSSAPILFGDVIKLRVPI